MKVYLSVPSRSSEADERARVMLKLQSTCGDVEFCQNPTEAKLIYFARGWNENETCRAEYYAAKKLKLYTYAE